MILKDEFLAEWKAEPTAAEYTDEARIVNLLIPLIIGRMSDEEFDAAWGEAVELAQVTGNN